MTTALVHFEKARYELAQATRIDEVKVIRDKAQALRAYIKQQGESLTMQNQCAEITLRAERRAGEMLADNESIHAGGGALSHDTTLPDLGISKDQSSNWQKIAGMPEEGFEEYIADTKEADRELTTAGLLRVIGKPHVAQASGENEWYTPADYIESAKAVMGGIDLDPASTAEANRVVGAKRFFTIADNGLERKWKGRLWMNPPYAQPLISQFAAKLVEHVKARDVSMALVLVNNATETAWFQAMLSQAKAVCFPAGRVKFWAVDRIAAPLQGQAVIAIGVERKRFCNVFKRHGLCLVTQ